MLEDEKIRRLRNWARGKPQGPISIELIPTDKCNLNCRSCWRNAFTKEQLQERYTQELPGERFLKLIDEGAEIGLKEVAFVGGGEPMLSPVILPLMKKIKGYGMEGDIVTNGTCFTEESIELLIKIGWDRIKFSIDGPDPETNDDLRGVPGTFEIIIDTIKIFSKLKRDRKIEKPWLVTETVLSRKNYRRLPEMVNLAYKIGINEMLLLPLTVFDDSMKDMKLNQEEIQEFKPILEKTIELLKKFGIWSNYEEYFNSKYIEKTESMHEVMMEAADEEMKNKIIEEEYGVKKDPLENFKYLPCFIPWHHITILPNGNIAPCFSPWVWETKVSIKDHSLKELWYGEYFDNFRHIMLTRNLPESCRTCCVWEVFKNRKIRAAL